MKKVDIFISIQEELGKLSVSLLKIDNRLEKIEELIINKDYQDTENENCHSNIIESFSPNEKLSKAQTAKILNISIRTLDRYRQKGIILFSQVNNGKVTFKYKDIIAVRDKVKGFNHGKDYFLELTDMSNK